MAGFGDQTHYAKLARGEFMGTGIYLSVCVVAGHPCIELMDGAAAVQKTGQRLLDWASREGVTVYKCQDGAKKFRAIRSDDYIEFLIAEIDTDNPWANMLMRSARRADLNDEIDLARAEGRSYFTMRGHKIRFNEQGYVLASDWAAAMGMTEEELTQGIESPEFQRWLRSRW